MALFIMIIRKMVQNKWLVASLLAGIVMTVALVSSMPIYSEAVMTRMLKKDLEQLQLDKNVYPGAYYANVTFTTETPEQMRARYDRIDPYMHNDAVLGFDLPVIELVNEYVSMSMKMRRPDDPDPESTRNLINVTIKAYENLEEHVTVKDGRLPAKEPVDGVYEVMLTEPALIHYKTVLGQVFTIEDKKVAEPIKLKPVGIIEKKLDDDPYFRYGNLGDMKTAFIMNADLAKQHMLSDVSLPLAYVGWYFVLDYSVMELRHVSKYLSTHDEIRNKILQHVTLYQMSTDPKALATINNYEARIEQLRTLMWALNVPILLMLGFYMFMVSNLIASRQKNEIAVIRSRGAARWQIVASYLVEGALLCGIAFAVGPLLGALLTEVLGSSNGFMEFVQRVRLPVRITAESYEYGGITAIACLVIMMVPIVAATRVSIVNHKQQMARSMKTPLWHKMFLDVLTLGIAIYGLYAFRNRMADLQSLGLEANDLTFDPMQFVIPALFIMGAGLLLLRLYPWVLRLIYWAGRKWWSPSLYATLIQVSRSSNQYQFLMIFLVMTIATGVFSAASARTINTNIEDRIQYANGGDIILTSRWINDAPPPSPLGGPPSEQSASVLPSRVNYLEPPVDPYRELPGVEHVARVFTKTDASFQASGATGVATGVAMLIGIDTDEFGMTTWFRDGLLDYSLNDYLNLIASDTSAVLISRTLADQKNVKAGDTIWIGWQDVTQQPFKIYGVIDYFPTFNPNPTRSGNTASSATASNAPMLIVGHLPRIQVQLAIEPYQLWLKMKPDATTRELYESIEESRLSVEKIVNTREALIRAKNDPFLMALNGVLTLGFVLSILVSFAGFLLYWVLSLQGRSLQNGILRAIGMSLRSLISMLGVEQLLTSGVAVLLGVLVGNLASILYVPNLQIAFNPASLVPPFIVQFDQADFVRIYTLVGIMLAIGLGILAFMLSRLRINQALKLGED